jgi:hypothetical protein
MKEPIPKTGRNTKTQKISVKEAVSYAYAWHNTKQPTWIRIRSWIFNVGNRARLLWSMLFWVFVIMIEFVMYQHGALVLHPHPVLTYLFAVYLVARFISGLFHHRWTRKRYEKMIRTIEQLSGVSIDLLRLKQEMYRLDNPKE